MHILIIDKDKKAARKVQDLLKKGFDDVQIDKLSDYNEAVELCKCYINIFSRNYRHLHGLVEIALSEGEKKCQK